MDNENNEKKIVAIYTRVSTDDQARDGYSLGEQLKRITKHCENFEYEIYKIYEEPGISAKNTKDRPKFNQMIEDMKAKKFNMIVAIKIDRISRDLIDFLKFMESAKNYECDVEFILDKVDTSKATGRMLMNMLAVFAQFERELIVERTNIGVKAAIEDGHFSGPPPLGYIRDENSRFTINEEEVPIVREIFDLCLNGKTYSQISYIMKEKYPKVIAKYKVDKKTGKKKPIYRKWEEDSFSKILNNKTYIGIYEWGKSVKGKEVVPIIGKLEPIISEEVFMQCQENIERNKRNYYRNKNYLFMQKIKCPNCERIMACNGAKKKDGREYLYYKCKDCNEYIREEWIEDALVDKLQDILELYLAVEGTYFPIDSELAEDFNNCKINNKIRFAIDSNIIEEKLNFVYTSDLLKPIWDKASYEIKSGFITKYVDYVEVKKSESGRKKPYIDIVSLNLKSHKIQMMAELAKDNLIDEVINRGGFRISKAEYKKETEANKYINILKKKYNFNIIDASKNKDYYINENLLFKIIDIEPTRKVEKPKTLFLELCDEDEEIEQEVLY